MKFKSVFDIIFEERNGGDFGGFHVEVGEDEGNIPHFHLICPNDYKKNTAIRLDMPFYFLHGSKKYILNAKEKKLLIAWLNLSNINGEITKDADGNLPKCNWENLRNCWNVMYPSNQVHGMRTNYMTLSKDYKNQS